MERSRAIVRVAILVVLIGGALLAAWRLGLLSDAARAKATLQGWRQVRGLPVWFVAGYTVTAALGIPPVVMTLAGGAVFGAKFGILYSWIGAILGAIGGYAIARWVGGNAVRQLLGRHRKKLDKLLDHAGFASLFRLRVNPIVPYNAVNFASGVAKVPFTAYVLSTIVGVLPATAVYAYFADTVIAGATGAKERALWHIAIAGVVMILLSYGPALWRRVHR